MGSNFKLKRSHMIAASLAALCVLAVWWGIWFPLGSEAEVREIMIDRGQNLSQIAAELQEAGVIRSKYLFMLYVLARNDENQLQAGRYKLGGMSIAEVEYRLAEGLAESDDVKLVIPEGSNIWHIDQAIVKAGLAQPGEFARQYYLREGKLFPDTYRLKKGATIEEIAIKFRENYAAKSGNPDNYILTTASLLEREAKKPEDMAMVADIIYRRLERGMMLQIDATVGYGWCLARAIPRSFSEYCDVSQAPIVFEIKKDGEFNTYTRHGLPPRPIANPGTVAINAAKNPIPNEYLYYLSTRDGSQIIYSKTGEEHAANRRKYLGL